MDSLYMDHLLLTNLLNLYANKAKIMMKTKNRITQNPNFAKEMCILSIKDASKYKKSIISNWLKGFNIVLNIYISYE